ncbi:MAG: hypothetical protein WC834_00200 [Eubacteriales bacterium]
MKLTLLFWLVICKDLTIGSEFNPFLWYKYGMKYIKWYFSRETFGEYLDREAAKRREEIL